MSKAIISESLLEAIADAIRGKTGDDSLLTPAEMAEAIANIQTGVTPAGTMSILQNGTFDVTNYASADVLVPSSGITIDEIAKNEKPTGDVTLSSSVTYISAGAFYGKPLTGISAPEVTSIGKYAFYGCPNIVKAIFPKITSLGNNNNYQFQESKIQQIAFPKSTGNLPSNILQACSLLTTVDAGKSSSIQSRATATSASFNTLILRKTDGITSLANVDGIASGTKFKSGGAGGTIYIPTTLYNHLGDGTSLDYQSASNWATVYGYGTITWAKLEGSIYESEDWLTL